MKRYWALRRSTFGCVDGTNSNKLNLGRCARDAHTNHEGARGAEGAQ